jgi:hypothetical protein
MSPMTLVQVKKASLEKGSGEKANPITAEILELRQNPFVFLRVLCG